MRTIKDAIAASIEDGCVIEYSSDNMREDLEDLLGCEEGTLVQPHVFDVEREVYGTDEEGRDWSVRLVPSHRYAHPR